MLGYAKHRLIDVVGDIPHRRRLDIDDTENPVEDCYGLSEWMCYSIAQQLTPSNQGKLKILAAW